MKAVKQLCGGEENSNMTAAVPYESIIDASTTTRKPAVANVLPRNPRPLSIASGLGEWEESVVVGRGVNYPHKSVSHGAILQPT